MKKLIVIGILISSFLEAKIQDKTLICGVCKNVESSIPFTIRNMERAGSLFSDYHVIIYENNSTDRTKELLAKWASKNPKVTILSETLSLSQMRENVFSYSHDNKPSRLELISIARNKLLNKIRASQYNDYKYVIMADLDFQSRWPIAAIKETVLDTREWDCVGANGIDNYRDYYDRHALRLPSCPLGPEMLSELFWDEAKEQKIQFHGTNWVPAYSAFGGLAIYKRKSLIAGQYYGVVTKYYEEDIKNILKKTPINHPQLVKYRQINNIHSSTRIEDYPIIFCSNSGYTPIPVSIDHVGLHTTMRLKGYDKIFINPKMFIHYDVPKF
ncbi:MAG: hypothetical protein P0S95_00180 [Rhabdochlamydiaceae bacterium]|nr:hypothetical protein [Candidatus Amphrikana amoebophyrae]